MLRQSGRSFTRMRRDDGLAGQEEGDTHDFPLCFVCHAGTPQQDRVPLRDVGYERPCATARGSSGATGSGTSAALAGALQFHDTGHPTEHLGEQADHVIDCQNSHQRAIGINHGQPANHLGTH